MEWRLRRGDKEEREKDGVEETLPLVFSRHVNVLRCRISFISYWCYSVLSGPPSACKGILVARLRGQVCVQLCVCVEKRSQQLFQTTDRPTRPSRTPTVHPARHSEANLLKCVSCNFSALLGYLCIFPFVNLFLNVIGALYSNLLKHLLIVAEHLLLWVLKLKTFVTYCVFFPPPFLKPQMHTENDKLAPSRDVASVRKTFLSKMLDLRPRHNNTWYSKISPFVCGKCLVYWKSKR